MSVKKFEVFVVGNVVDKKFFSGLNKFELKYSNIKN